MRKYTVQNDQIPYNCVRRGDILRESFSHHLATKDYFGEWIILSSSRFPRSGEDAPKGDNNLGYMIQEALQNTITGLQQIDKLHQKKSKKAYSVDSS